MISGVVDLGRDNDARLVRLRTALALGTGFQLILVEAEPGPIRKEVIRRIQTWSGRGSIARLALVSLKADAPLAAQLGGASGAIVTGLEPERSVEPPARGWIAELNWTRDALPELVSGPLILVVSQVAHRALFEQAPDLYSWRRHTAQVTVTVRELAMPLSSPMSRFWLEQRKRLTDILGQVVLTPFGHATLLIDLAKTSLQLGDEHDALRAFEIAESISPLDDEEVALIAAYCKLGRAECALVRRDLGVARELLGELEAGAHVHELKASLAFRLGTLHAADGAWDEAVRAFASSIAVGQTIPAPYLLARAREGLAQVAFARGDIAGARREIADLVRLVTPHRDTWGSGLLLRIAEVLVDVYPAEVSSLVDELLDAKEPHSCRDEVMIARCLRARRARLLGHAELARAELVHAERWIRADDPAEMHASIALCKAMIARALGGLSDDEIASHLARARELYRSCMPQAAAVAAVSLGDLWRGQRRYDRAVTAYRLAATDARGAADLAFARQAELSEIGVAIEGEIAGADTPDRLGVLVEQFRSGEQIQSEGIARAALGRCLLRRGLRDAAAAELERARACFEATTDAAQEARVLELLGDDS